LINFMRVPSPNAFRTTAAHVRRRLTSGRYRDPGVAKEPLKASRRGAGVAQQVAGKWNKAREIPPAASCGGHWAGFHLSRWKWAAQMCNPPAQAPLWGTGTGGSIMHACRVLAGGLAEKEVTSGTAPPAGPRHAQSNDNCVTAWEQNAYHYACDPNANY
jgi:hypothetical protein